MIVLAACGGSRTSGTLATLRSACEPAYFWDSGSCKPRGDGAKQIATGKQALIDQNIDQAKTSLAAADHGGPLDHETNVLLWEQRGIAAGFLEDKSGAATAFGMLLALDPGHYLSYNHKPEVTMIFERERDAAKKAGPPTIDVNWPQALKTGEAVPLEIEVVADPKQFMRRATVFVRTRGDAAWHAADLALAAKATRLLIPPVNATHATSLELYLRAYDDQGNEVLAWADPTRPREIPLRYDPPPRWYRSWKTYAIGGTAVAVITGIIVYAVTLSPPDTAGGNGIVK